MFGKVVREWFVSLNNTTIVCHLFSYIIQRSCGAKVVACESFLRLYAFMKMQNIWDALGCFFVCFLIFCGVRDLLIGFMWFIWFWRCDLLFATKCWLVMGNEDRI